MQVSSYQDKLRQLESRQEELVRDNRELKDLCLYLDEERNSGGVTCDNCRRCGAPASIVARTSAIDTSDSSSLEMASATSNGSSSVGAASNRQNSCDEGEIMLLDCEMNSILIVCWYFGHILSWNVVSGSLPLTSPSSVSSATMATLSSLSSPSSVNEASSSSSASSLSARVLSIYERAEAGLTGEEAKTERAVVEALCGLMLRREEGEATGMAGEEGELEAQV